MNNSIQKILALALIGLNTAFANNISLIHEDDGKSFFLKESSPINLSGKLEATAIGLCLKNNEETCSRKINFSESHTIGIALMSGVLQIPEGMRSYYVFPDYDVNVTSKILKSDSKFTLVETEAMVNVYGSKSSLGAKTYKHEKTKLDIDFNHADESQSNRLDYSEVEDKYKKYHRSVFQIDGVSQDNGLGLSSTEHGTGFFISKDGHALTNLHVMQSNPSCLENRSCEITIKQKNETIREIKVPVRILTCSQKNDFCLFKVNLSESKLDILPLEIETNKISKQLLTLGFPGDKLNLFTVDGEEVEEVALTYAYGSPIGFSGTGISSSMFISGGASGSPIIDLKTGKVVGLNSNGAETFAQDQDGAPAIFRTLYLLNKDFGIQDYLGGEKQLKIESMINDIKNIDDAELCKAILKLYEQEKTSYGVSKIQVLSYSHISLEVRRELVRFLLKMRYENW